MPIFHLRKAQSLFELNCFEESLKELNFIQDKEDGEINLLIGNIFKSQGNIKLALKYFSLANDGNSPKQGAVVKELIERVLIEEVL